MQDKQTSDIKQENGFELRDKHPGRVPVLCNTNGIGKKIMPGTKKFLVPGDITLMQFLYILRKRLQLKPHDALFVYINNELPPLNITLDEIYEHYFRSFNDDGFVYIEYSHEKTFG